MSLYITLLTTVVRTWDSSSTIDVRSSISHCRSLWHCSCCSWRLLMISQGSTRVISTTVKKYTYCMILFSIVLTSPEFCISFQVKRKFGVFAMWRERNTHLDNLCTMEYDPRVDLVDFFIGTHRTTTVGRLWSEWLSVNHSRDFNLTVVCMFKMSSCGYTRNSIFVDTITVWLMTPLTTKRENGRRVMSSSPTVDLVNCSPYPG